MKSGKQVLSDKPTTQNPVRWLPGVVIVIIQWLLRYVLPLVMAGDKAVMIGVFAGLLGGLAVVIWWIFFSRVPKSERWGAILLIIVAMFATSHLLDKSIATANMGMMFIIYSVPVMSLALVVWTVASRRLSKQLRLITMVITILIASGVWTLIRTDGMTSQLHHDLRWRWARTDEQRFLAKVRNEKMVQPVTTAGDANWPGFRGPNRDGIIHGVRIKKDWIASPPTELWRRQVGPGCSSFAISGNMLYTQEQRGDDEAVTCYDLTSGKPVWIHSDKVRFWDSHAGAGPRATPTIYQGRICTFGATGVVNMLNASDGSVIWSRNAASDTKAKDSGWGFTSSPLVTGDVVIIAATGKLVAYDLATGEPRWYGPDGGRGYSSPHLITVDGVAQVMLMSTTGATSLEPADGKQLWTLAWPLEDPILQPALIAEGDILLSGSMQKGLKRIAVTHETGQWKIKERWTSTGIMPYFNDFVVNKGYAYGFNGLSLACIAIEDGKRIWRGGRYGGQLILFADQDMMLVLSEKGELALVAATPDRFTEFARFPAIKGKTWNHPVLVGDVLVVRNSQEMVAFRLPLE